MNTKPIPIIITLAAAFISCLMSIFQGKDFSVFVYRLLIVVVVFLVLGTIIKMILDYSFKTLDEGEEASESEEDEPGHGQSDVDEAEQESEE